MSFILIYTTSPNKKVAEKIISNLLSNKFVVCANFFPIKSTYLWEGKLKKSNEIVSILKAKKSNWNKIKNEIEKIHPYKTPCIIKLNVESNLKFDEWINN
jgi:periplasmic divalent cation tolerance protein